MRFLTLLMVLASGEHAGYGQASGAFRPRIVISSDFPPIDVIPGALGTGPLEKRSDPDDVQSIIRFLVYANEFRVEGLIASAGTLANIAQKHYLLDVLDRYERVEQNLRLHDRAFPSASYLRERTKEGLGGTYRKPAAEIIGEGKDSEASRFIIELVDRPDPSPIWFCSWGGSQELGQALWRVQQTRSPHELKRFVSKLRVYLIAAQDGSAQWMIEKFPDLMILFSERAFSGMHFNARGSVSTTGDLAWLDRHVRSNHGPLGAIYPKSGWNHKAEGVIEGDTPSFLYILSGTRGLSDVNQPAWGGWGGRFQPMKTSPFHWIESEEGGTAIARWHDARQRDFAARMDWCVQPAAGANHAPLATLNGDRGVGVLFRDAMPGENVVLDASGSGDSDGQALTYAWWIYREAGTYAGELEIHGAASRVAHLSVPRDAGKTRIHVILQVTDSGSPPLTSYRRLIVNVRMSP